MVSSLRSAGCGKEYKNLTFAEEILSYNLSQWVSQGVILPLTSQSGCPLSPFLFFADDILDQLKLFSSRSERIGLIIR